MIDAAADFARAMSGANANTRPAETEPKMIAMKTVNIC
jgi:hypothetical protein